MPTVEARLRPFVARRVSSAADVGNVVQEVFLRLQWGLDEQRFGPWVYQVAHHAVVDHHRAQARHPVPVGDVDELTLVVDEDESESQRALVMCTASLVATLPTHYREALTLTVPQAQAVEKVALSVSWLPSRGQRGREL